MQTIRNADFLSSIEIMVADKLDVLQMQNWEHVQVCLKRFRLLSSDMFFLHSLCLII